MAAFNINRQAIARMQREIQREFDKRPISVPLRADPGTVTAPSGGNVTVHYDGPIVQINGDNAQVAWTNSGSIQQTGESHQIAPGFEALAQAVADTIGRIGSYGLSETDTADAQAIGEDILRGVTATNPDRSVIRRAVNTLKGLLAPIAMGMSAGAADGAAEWAHTAVQQLTQALPG